MTVTLRPEAAPPRPTGLRAELARDPSGVRAAQALRHLCFIERRGLPARPGGLDADAHDALCLHLLVRNRGEEPVGAARLRLLGDGAALRGSYAAATHDLAALARLDGPYLELGRVCVRPGAPEGPVLLAAWAHLARLVDAAGVRVLFGCSSFEGADPARHRPALALLGRDHALAGPCTALAPETLDLRGLPPPTDRLAALRAVPPLLRTYLAMGGRVGPHAVVDRDLDTVQVLTAVEIARVPPARARALRALASADPAG